jgi:Family of unknown function (DUF6232)
MDEVIFQKQGITITKTMARFGNATYPIANIGAVTIEHDASSLGGWTVVIALGGFIAFMAGSIGWGVGLLGVAFASGLMARKNDGLKLMLRTSSGNEQAFASTDKTLVAGVKAAVEQAIVQRG